MAETNPSSNDPVRVLIVDVHPSVREGLTDRLNADPDIDVRGTAATADEALRLVMVHDAQVVVIDAQMPNRAGYLLCRAIHEQHPATRCVLHTALNADENDHNHGGTVAVVAKQLFGYELSAAIHRLANHRRGG